MAEEGLTRRTLLLRSGALGAGLVAWNGLREAPAALASPPQTLSAAHLRTYAAVVVAVSAARQLPRDASVVRQRTAHLQQAYGDAAKRRHIHSVIAGLDAASAPRRFVSLSATRRLALLRALQETPIQTTGSEIDFTNLAKRQLAADAQALVLSPAGTGDYSAAAPTPL